MFWCKVFPTKYDFVVAICDEHLLGKKLKFKQMDIFIAKNFYGAQLIDANIAVKVMGRATIGNLFGKEIVEVAEKNGFISRENVVVIDKVPHAQFAKLQ